MIRTTLICIAFYSSFFFTVNDMYIYTEDVFKFLRFLLILGICLEMRCVGVGNPNENGQSTMRKPDQSFNFH